MKRAKRKKKKLHPNFIGLLGVILAFVIIFSFLSIKRYNSFEPSAYDMGIMIQTVWNTSQGWIFQESINMGYNMSRFWMAHWEFIYLIVALFYKLISTPYLLFIFQTVCVALGAIPIYYLAKEKFTDHTTALVFGLLYFLYPAIHNATLFDVHGVTFAVSFLIFAFYYLQKNQLKQFAFFGFIALICREDSALLLFMMGVYSFFILKQKKVGASTAIISMLYFIVWYKRMTIRAMFGLPEFTIMEGAESHWAHLSAVKDNPLYVINFLVKKYNLTYLLSLLGPVAFISLFSPTILLIASPIFVINLLSDYYYTHGIEHQYSATIVPFILISAIYGAHNVADFLKDRVFKKTKKRDIVEITYSIMFITTLVFFFLDSNVLDVRKWKVTDHHKSIKRVIAKIEDSASVTALNKIVPHVAERHEIFVFDDHVNDVDYILYDFYAPEIRLIDRSTYHLPAVWPYNEKIKQVLKNSNYGVFYYEDGVCLFKKDFDYDKGLKNLALSAGTEIDIYNEKSVNDQINFLGYNTYPLLKMWHQQEGVKGLQWEKQLHFTCFWTTGQSQLDTTSFVFKIQNENQQYIFFHNPVYNLYPSYKWQKNDIIKDEVFWNIPKEVTAGEYKIWAAAITDSNQSEIGENSFIHLFDLEIE